MRRILGGRRDFVDMATLPPPQIRFALITAPEGEDGEKETVRLSRTQPSDRGVYRIGFPSLNSANQREFNFHTNFSAVSWQRCRCARAVGTVTLRDGNFPFSLFLFRSHCSLTR